MIRVLPERPKPTLSQAEQLAAKAKALSRDRQVLQHGVHDGTKRMTIEEVRLIREMYAKRTHPIIQIARLFGVGETTVQNILRGRTWKGIE
jgi:transcriptional regulator with PAS, ATPase and Fis domain